MSIKRAVIDGIIAREGGYVNDPSDSGGETNWGITVATARAYGYTGPMAAMPRAVAEAIYSRRFWDDLRLDAVEALSPQVAAEVADSAVNCGPVRAVEWLQRSLDALNGGGTLYPDVDVDGRMGPATIGALAAYLRARGPGEGSTVLLRALNGLQTVHYLDLAARREKDKRFVYGWLRERVV